MGKFDDVQVYELVERISPPGLRGYDAKALSDATALAGAWPSMVQQQFREEVDINTIVERFGITQSMPFGSAQGVYGDFTDVQSYDDAQQRIEDAQEAFMKLPPEVRERFGNDPGRLIQEARSMKPSEFEASLRQLVEKPADGVGQ